MFPPLLRAFRHPIILLSIAVLLLNDHIFKALTPSWVTGKVSDFAGLFFFPFLMGVFLQTWNPKRISSRRSLLISFVLTGIVFASIKMLPVLNVWASGLLSHLFRQTIYIALDPTDCLALIVFLPAWNLWKSIEHHKETTAPGKITYLALAVGSLAVLATSPCPPMQKVTRLAFDGAIVYAGIGFSSQIENIGYILASPQGWEDWHTYMYRQYDEWQVEPQYETLAKNPFTEPHQMPVTTCDPLVPTHCYRIDGTARVEESRNGGESWATAWQPPASREDFRQRLAGGILFNCGKTPDLQTFDLLLIPGEPASTLLVAMGNEGLLVHPAQGGWQAVGISTAPNDRWGIRIVPTPFAVRSLGEAINTTTSELLLAVTVGLLTWSILSIWMRENILNQIETPTEKKIKSFTLPAKITFLWTLLIPAAIIYLTPRNAMLLLSYLASPFWIVLAGLVVWHIFNLPANIPSTLRQLERYVFLCGIGIISMGWMPMGLWAYGLIERYVTALVLSIGIGLAAIAGSVIWLRQRVKSRL